MDGKYLSSDDYFLERRRRGLLRFLDQVIKHPLLRKEKFVVMFLTVDTDMSSFRKQALMQISDELTGKVVSPNFTKEWDEQYQMQKWKETFQTTDKMLSAVLQLCHASERQSKRLQAMSEEYKRMSRAFRKLTETVGDSVFQVSGDLPAITDGLKTAFGKTSDCGDLITDESRSLDYGLLEDLKQFRDQLIAIKEIFVRFRRLGKNSIPQLENRVANNSNRLRQLEGFADAKKSEINLLKESIAKDRMSIEYERNRSWLIRQCITDELGLCQKIVYQISKFLRDWSLDCTKYAELYTDNWIGLNNEVSELPLPS